MDRDEKLYGYQQLLGRGNIIKQNLRDYLENWREAHPTGVKGIFKDFYDRNFCTSNQVEFSPEYLHVFQKKTRWELVRISAAVTGIEFSYAAETAFVSPTLLKIGVEHKRMTLVWALSPLIGFFLTPVLGSLSDRCQLPLGRRRPFIILMSIGVFFGLILVPNGEYFGYMLGDPKPPDLTNSSLIVNETHPHTVQYTNWHPWGIFLTILGTVLLDFNADGCQSPARAYLLDITIPEDHARGLSTFTIMAGLGGSFGYALGGIDWDKTAIGEMLGGHVRAVFTLITGIFIACVIYTVTSFREIPLRLLNEPNFQKMKNACLTETTAETDTIKETSLDTLLDAKTASGTSNQISYGAINDEKMCRENEQDPKMMMTTNEIDDDLNVIDENSTQSPSVKMYLKSIIFMPNSLRILCLTNLFCWMAHVCYSLYFTDFVGEAVFNGNPTALLGTKSRDLYEEGVRFGCWGMSLYSLSCACYSLVIEKLICRYGARRVYVGGLLVYSTGMFFMALCRNKAGVIIFSWTAGIMYSTLFTMPYLLISEYHEKKTFIIKDSPHTDDINSQLRGLGTDVALVSSMVFLAQFILSMCMGTIVSCAGTTTAVVAVASVLSLCGALSATQVMYLD